MNKFIEHAPEIIEQSAKSPLGLTALMVLVLAVLALVFFKTAPVKVRIGIFVMLFLGVVGFAATVMWQTGRVAGETVNARATPSSVPPLDSERKAEPAPRVPRGPSASPAGLSAQAGHLVYKVLGTEVKTYATGNDGKPSKLLLRVSLRVTDVMGIADYVDRRTIRLAVDGAELLPENSLNVAVYAKQMAETDVSFIIPAQINRVELLVGRSEDATAKIFLELKL